MGSSYRPQPPRPGAMPAAARPSDRNFELKSLIHKKLIGVLNLDRVSSVPKDRLRTEIGRVVERLLEDERVPMTTAEQNKIVEEVLDEVLGLGPLEPLLKEPSISDILVNRHDKVFIERNGKLSETSVRFKDDAHLLHIIEKIVSQVGRRIDEAQPIVDARLADGSRVNAIIPPLALDGPCVSIRRFGRHVITQDEMIQYKTLMPSMMKFLAACVQSKATVLISGGTGSGKTTMLNALSRFIPEEERIITIEDTAELQLQQRHVVKFETRPPNLNKEGGINQRQLLRTALRMRPDRIIVGECRGAEALDMLQAMNTGVEGSMSTVHANTPRDAFSRLETMVLMADLEIPTRVILQQLASAIRLVVQVSRLQDGTRKIVSIAEVLGVADDRIQLQDIFVFERLGVTDAGKVQGKFRGTGVMPKIMDRLRVAGIQVPPTIFEEVVPVNL
ncbi:MAG: CpaF family protein [Acidobacteria bacterium]|nr:CpaF family protein [Acidobacteriota bacterium]MBI3471494.1 CpaF family protein [Candidatus Solibacter usitatus]